jgi:competence protein CoiA
MQVANSHRGEKCISWETEKTEGPFVCPGCSCEVILKKGKIKEHHFAHKPPFDCTYGTGESQIHYKCKREIFEALLKHPDCIECEIEKTIGRVRVDVYAKIGSTKVAIEVQKSNISFEDISKKAFCFKSRGIFALWLIPAEYPAISLHKETGKEVCRLKEWEKIIHTMYFGRIYYWNHGLFVIPYHFGPFKINVEERDWYDEYGEEQSSDGYEYYARSKRIPIKLPRGMINIVDDFKKKYQKQVKAKKWSTPSCLIWIDTEKTWW